MTSIDSKNCTASRSHFNQIQDMSGSGKTSQINFVKQETLQTPGISSEGSLNVQKTCDPSGSRLEFVESCNTPNSQGHCEKLRQSDRETSFNRGTTTSCSLDKQIAASNQGKTSVISSVNQSECADESCALLKTEQGRDAEITLLSEQQTVQSSRTLMLKWRSKTLRDKTAKQCESRAKSSSNKREKSSGSINRTGARRKRSVQCAINSATELTGDNEEGTKTDMASAVCTAKRRRRGERGGHVKWADLNVRFLTSDPGQHLQADSCSDGCTDSPTEGCTDADSPQKTLVSSAAVKKRRQQHMQKAPGKKAWMVKTRENPHFPSHTYSDPTLVLRLELSEQLTQQWRLIGNQRGLVKDSDIAAFLIQLYQDSETQCSTCQSPLQLLCSACLTSSPLQVTPDTATHPPDTVPCESLSPAEIESSGDESESEGEEENGVDAPPAKQVLPSPPVVLKGGRCGRSAQSHVCPECGSKFARSGGLKVHMRIHTGEKPYMCSECGQGFSQSGQLTVHLRKHKGERPFTCALCPASFPLAGSLKQHMRVHTGDRPYACPQCPRRFSYAGDLTVHRRKHSGDRPFLCSDCGKSFAVSSDLSKHKKIHSDHRPFKCSVCHKGFPFLNRLTLHMRTHTGDKPFLCADCGSSFSRASNLTVHRRVHHTFEKPFVCPVCQHAFADSANLSKHKKNKHGKVKMANNTSQIQISSSSENLSAISFRQGQPGSFLQNNSRVLPGEGMCNSGHDRGGGEISRVTISGDGQGQGQINGQLAESGQNSVMQSDLEAVFPFSNYYYH